MLKRLARILIILIILVWLYRYTSIFDNTKIKPYLEKINTKIENIFTKNSTGSQSVIEDNPNQIDQGITWATAFNDNDIINFETSSSVKPKPQSTGNTEDMNSNINNNQNQEVEEVDSQILDIKLSDLWDNWNNFENGCVTPWWEKIKNGSYFIAYGQQVSRDCGREKRYCSNGKLDGNYQYDTCYYSDVIDKQQQNSMLTQTELKDLQFDLGLNTSDKIVEWGVVWTKNSDNIGEKDKMEIYADGISWNDSTTMGLRVSNNDPEKHFLGKDTEGIDIQANGQTSINNNVFKSATLKKQLQNKPKTTFITNNKKVNAKNSHARKICTTPRWSVISNWQFVYAFKSTTAQWNSCELETRFCFDGQLQWSFVNANCKGAAPTIVDTPKESPTSSFVTVAFTETRNALRYLPVSLELMASTPMKKKTQYTTLQTSTYINTEWTSQPFNTIGQSYLIYHQPDEVNHGNQPPEYMFVGASSIQ